MDDNILAHDEHQNTLPDDVQQRIGKTLGKAIAAVIMMQVPFLSFVSFFLGLTASKTVKELYKLCLANGIAVPAKLKIVKILANIGKFVGLAYSIMITINLISFIANIISGDPAHFGFYFPIFSI